MIDILYQLYQIGDNVNVILLALFSVLAFSCTQKYKEEAAFYYLITGFYTCLLMGTVYYLLTWFLLEYPYVISPGNLSWVGGIVFLITAAVHLIGKWTPEQKSAARRFRLLALAGPAVCIAFSVAYIIIYPDIVVNYLLYGIPTAILSYYALWLFLAARKCGVQPGLRLYHLMTLLWIAAQLFHDLFSTLGSDWGYAVHMTICSGLIVLVTPFIYLSVRKGVDI
jgi:hypothetical protein